MHQQCNSCLTRNRKYSNSLPIVVRGIYTECLQKITSFNLKQAEPDPAVYTHAIANRLNPRSIQLI